MRAINICLALLFVLWISAESSTAKEPTPVAGNAAATPPSPSPAPGANTPVSAYEVLGFRSAKFGMAEEDTRKAIIRDFSVKSEAVKEEENPIVKTRMLLVEVSNLLPKSGKAQVFYVFGYESHNLMQVIINWSKDVDPTLTPAILAGNSNLLLSYFEGQQFKAGSVRVNDPLPNGRGVLVFRGADVKGHGVVLTLSGRINERTETDNGGEKRPQKELIPERLELSYIADPNNPDIFRIAPGQF